MTKCDEVAHNMPLYPVTFDEALALVRLRTPDESAIVRGNIAEALLGRVPLRIRQQAAARTLSDSDIQRHAAIATDNGAFDPTDSTDSSFTTACELERQHRGLASLHEGNAS